jgi:RNA polymerase sigma-70 factor (ECF subfamily)
VNRESNPTGEEDSETISDSECVSRVQNGDVDAFEILRRRHQKSIYNLAYRMLGADPHEAEEITHVVFIQAYKSIRKFRGKSSFYTWLYRIAVNQAKNRRQQLARERKVFTDPSSDSDLAPEVVDTRSPEQITAKKEFWGYLQNALNRLSSDHCEIFTLINLQGVSYEDAAEILDIPLNTVKSRLSRAREALAKDCEPLLKEWSQL